MKYCSHCKVYIRGDRERCVLCENTLKKAEAETENIFPVIPPLYESKLALKIMVFISIIAIVVSVAFSVIFPAERSGSILFIFAILSIWAGLINILQKRHQIPKKIVWQVFIVSVLAILWDYRIGWIGWSLDYVIPIASISAMIIMYVTAKIMKLSVGDYITYALIDSVFGIVPLLFLLLNLVDVIIPSIISIGFSVISLSGIFIFQGKAIREEIQKRMHI